MTGVGWSVCHVAAPGTATLKMAAAAGGRQRAVSSPLPFVARATAEPTAHVRTSGNAAENRASRTDVDIGVARRQPTRRSVVLAIPPFFVPTQGARAGCRHPWKVSNLVQ